MIAKKRAQNRYTMGYVLAFLDISKRILVYQSSITTTFAGISLSLRVTSLPISAIVYPHSGTYKFRFGNAVFRYLYGNTSGDSQECIHASYVSCMQKQSFPRA